MSINEEATLRDDLTELEPVEFIRAVQGLLLSNTSDAVRDRLEEQDVSLNDNAALPQNDSSFSAADLLESPFFLVKNLRTLPEVRANARSRRLSGNISKTARAILNISMAMM